MKEDMELKTLGRESGILTIDLHGQLAVVVVAENAKTTQEAFAAARKMFDALPVDAGPRLWKTVEGQAYVGPVEFVLGTYTSQPGLANKPPPHISVIAKTQPVEGDNP